MTHKVRLTIEPNKTVEVGDAEFLDLTRAGLIVKKKTARKKTPEAPATGETASSTPAEGTGHEHKEN